MEARARVSGRDDDDEEEEPGEERSLGRTDDEEGELDALLDRLPARGERRTGTCHGELDRGPGCDGREGGGRDEVSEVGSARWTAKLCWMSVQRALILAWPSKERS